MKTTRLFAHKLTAAQITAGDGNSLPTGSIIWEVDTNGIPTGKSYTATGGGVIEGGSGSSFREWQANTAYSQGQIAVAPLAVGTIGAGDLIVRGTQGTSRATFDATEASKWTEAADDPDLVKVADIKNDLTSTDTNKPLSAAQGKALQDGKSATTHNHDTAYEAKNANIQTHISSVSNPHSVTKSQVGLGNADNTSDTSKPISTAQQSALDLKAPIASPAFTGTPSAPTASAGTNTTQLATTAFVGDAVASLQAGLDFKNSVRAATTANITLSGAQTVDGVALAAGDRVLVKNQTTGSQNGVYDVAAGAWSRSSDANANNEVNAGMAVYVEQGTTHAQQLWYLVTTNVTLGTTALIFARFADTSGLQPSLVSGTNIKTIGGQSILGSGDVPNVVHIVTAPIAIRFSGASGVVAGHQVLVKIGESSGATGADFNLTASAGTFPSGQDAANSFIFWDSLGNVPYWIEQVTGSAPNRVAHVWLKPNITLSSAGTIFLSTAVTSAARGNAPNVFEYFTNFDSADGWTLGAGASVASGELQVTTNSNLHRLTALLSAPVKIEYRARLASRGANGVTVFGIGNPSNYQNDSVSVLWHLANSFTKVDANAWVNIADIPVNTYRIKSAVVSGAITYDFTPYSGGASVANGTLAKTLSGDETFWLGIRQDGGMTGQTEDVGIDWFFLRKHNATEPAFASVAQ